MEPIINKISKLSLVLFFLNLFLLSFSAKASKILTKELNKIYKSKRVPSKVWRIIKNFTFYGFAIFGFLSLILFVVGATLNLRKDEAALRAKSQREGQDKARDMQNRVLSAANANLKAQELHQAAIRTRKLREEQEIQAQTQSEQEIQAQTQSRPNPFPTSPSAGLNQNQIPLGTIQSSDSNSTTSQPVTAELPPGVPSEASQT